MEIKKIDIRKKYNNNKQKYVDMMIMREGVDVIERLHNKNPKKFDTMIKNLEEFEFKTRQ
tara:strand:- start:216 stop:395 length:180 start_codon:yes stop_codon:yes gene_type:complete